MDAFAALFFMLLLLVPALLLIARFGAARGARQADDERSRVQRQQEINVRRRVENRRTRVWQQIEAAYTSFREHEQTADAHRTNKLPADSAHPFTPDAISSAFDKFLSRK